METTNREDPNLRKIKENGQQESYLVLPQEERDKGYVRPYFETYTHVKCRTETRMGSSIAATYARNPKFYGATFCCHCGTHLHLMTADGPQFLWPNGKPVGE